MAENRQPDSSPPVSLDDLREPRHIGVRDGDQIWVDRERYRLTPHPASNEQVEIIMVVPK